MMVLANMEILREVERQLKESLDKRFDAFSAQFTEHLEIYSTLLRIAYFVGASPNRDLFKSW